MAAKMVSPDDLAWCEGEGSWTPIQALLGAVDSPAPYPPPPPPAAADAQVQGESHTRVQEKNALQGVGGWLTFFCVSLTILGPFWSLGQLTEAYDKAKPAFDRFPALKSAVDFETWGSAAIIIYGFVVGCMIWSGSPSGRRLARQYLIIRLIGFIAVEAIAFSMISGVSPAALGAGASEGFGAILQSLLYFAIWWLYFKRSKRVRNTYGPESTPPPPQPDLQAEPQSPPGADAGAIAVARSLDEYDR